MPESGEAAPELLAEIDAMLDDLNAIQEQVARLDEILVPGIDAYACACAERISVRASRAIGRAMAILKRYDLEREGNA